MPPLLPHRGRPRSLPPQSPRRRPRLPVARRCRVSARSSRCSRSNRSGRTRPRMRMWRSSARKCGRCRSIRGCGCRSPSEGLRRLASRRLSLRFPLPNCLKRPRHPLHRVLRPDSCPHGRAPLRSPLRPRASRPRRRLAPLRPLQRRLARRSLRRLQLLQLRRPKQSQRQNRLRLHLRCLRPNPQLSGKPRRHLRLRLRLLMRLLQRSALRSRRLRLPLRQLLLSRRSDFQSRHLRQT